MEVALRATNLLASLRLLRRSRALDEPRLASVLALLNAHGRHVRRNLEYSYIATGNHYLSDVAGLFLVGRLPLAQGKGPGRVPLRLTALLRAPDAPARP